MEIQADRTWSIAQGYRPGLLGRCTEMHALFYARHTGFGSFFESQVASGMAEFLQRLDNRRNAVWSLLHDGRIVGTIAIDGEDLKRDAGHLRWFIVDDSQRGNGAGKRLLAEALAFCDRIGFPEVELWTFAGLDAARHLYEKAGFRLDEERPGRRWGAWVMEQRFIRRRRGLDLRDSHEHGSSLGGESTSGHTICEPTGP
jgi:GNAT superfamily N-acetyltransferase